MTVAHRNIRRTGPLPTVENGGKSAYAFGLESRTATGLPTIPLKPRSRTPAPGDMPGANCGLQTGGRVGPHQLIAVELHDPALASLLPADGITVSTTSSTSFLLLTDLAVEPVRYTLRDRPLVTVHGRGGVILFDNSTEPNGRRVVVSGRRTHARDLPVVTVEALDALVAAAESMGAERDDSPEETGIDPSWSIDLRVEMLEAAVRKLQRQFDADDAPDAKPRRAHRRVNPVPDASSN